MWLLKFVPDWIFHLALLAGVLGLVASFFLSIVPFVKQYKLPLQIISVLVIVVAVWFEGTIYNEKVWLERIAELEAKVQIAEQKSKEENVRIQTKVVERVKVIKQNVDVIKHEIQVKKELINQGCELSDTAIEMYNRAVTNE
jgi:amino acid permease